MTVIELDGKKFILVMGQTRQDDCVGCEFADDSRCATGQAHQCSSEFGSVWAEVVE
jgi:hypothetical protein